MAGQEDFVRACVAGDLEEARSIYRNLHSPLSLVARSGHIELSACRGWREAGLRMRRLAGTSTDDYKTVYRTTY